MNEDLAQLLGRFPRARVAAVGDLVADEFVYGETDRISREAPVLIVRYESAELKPGCAANAIMNLCALGARVQAIGILGDDPGALEEAGRELLKTLRAQALLVTRGRNGMALLRPGAPTATVPVHGSAEAVDVTGAGDTVMAAATAAVAAGADPVQAMRIANVAGALKVQKPGTVAVSAEELSAELKRAEVAQPTVVMTAREASSRGRR